MMYHDWKKYLAIKAENYYEKKPSCFGISLSLGFSALEAFRDLTQAIKVLASYLDKECKEGELIVWVSEHDESTDMIIKSRNGALQWSSKDEEMSDRVQNARDKVVEWLRQKIVDRMKDD